MSRLLAELRRRNVFRVAVAYAIVGWLLAQVASVFAPALRLPDWVPSFVALLLILGLPVALFLAWAYELTPDGMKRTASMPASRSRTMVPGRRLDFVIIALLLVALGFVGAERYLVRGAATGAESMADRAGAPVADPDSAAAEDAAEPAPAEPKRIAVLPFVSLSADPEQEYFSEGISEELLNVLSSTPNLIVPSRTSAFSFKDTSAGLRTIANALNVTHILEGSVRKFENRVRIRAQLIDVVTDMPLWSETYERELIDVFAIQDEIAGNVALALQVELLDATSSSGARTDDIEAHDAYLRGLHHWGLQSSQDIARAQAEFRRALELDPDYALVHAELANLLFSARNYGMIEPADALARARPLIERALELDPNLPEAYLARATMRLDTGDRIGANADLERAVSLNPNLARAHTIWAFALSRSNRIAESHAALQKALELDPLNAFLNWSMGNLRLWQHRIDEAGVYYRRAVELEPEQPNSYTGLGDIDILTGRLDTALLHYHNAIAADPGQPHMTSIIGLLYHSLGDTERARLWFEHAANLVQSGSTARFFREFLPLVSRQENSDALMAVLRGIPGSQFGGYGSRLFRKAALATGDRPAIVAWYRQHWPELFEPTSEVTAATFSAATDVASLLAADGDNDAAARLAEQSLAIFRDPSNRPVTPVDWAFPMIEVEALVLLGRRDEALDAMRRAVDDGWRFDWWQVERDPTLESIRGDPKFVEMLTEVRADLARQLQNVRAMQANGEIVSAPPARP